MTTRLKGNWIIAYISDNCRRLSISKKKVLGFDLSSDTNEKRYN